MSADPPAIGDIVRRALLEDLGPGRDVTTEALIPAEAKGRAVMRARVPGVLAGLDAAVAAFRLTDPELSVKTLTANGDALKPGQDILTVEGPARGILTAERTALNFVMHLSGVATQTRAYVDAVKGTKAAISCTRKTLPGLRALQKQAVKLGGGRNHRFGLYDAILIKDNHIAIAGGVAEAIRRARASSPEMTIEVEVDTLDQLREALGGKPDIIMLDNMAPDRMREAVKITAGRALLEASGGVTLKTVRAIAETGVDIISVGALTHSVMALDIGLDIDL